MANRSNNIWAKAAAGSPGTNIARAQQSRWTGVPNETIMFLVEDKIGAMLEGISDATERNAAAQIQLALQKKLQAAAAKHGSLSKAAALPFRSPPLYADKDAWLPLSLCSCCSSLSLSGSRYFV